MRSECIKFLKFVIKELKFVNKSLSRKAVKNGEFYYSMKLSDVYIILKTMTAINLDKILSSYTNMQNQTIKKMDVYIKLMFVQEESPV